MDATELLKLLGSAEMKIPDKVLESDVEQRIMAEQYYVFPGTTTTVCALTIHSGFTCIGSSACVDPENFNQELGQSIARKEAFNKLWSHLGFELSQAKYMTKVSAAMMAEDEQHNVEDAVVLTE